MKNRPPKKMTAEEQRQRRKADHMAICGDSQGRVATVCAKCGATFSQSGYGELADAIMGHKPACSPECRKVLNP